MYNVKFSSKEERQKELNQLEERRQMISNLSLVDIYVYAINDAVTDCTELLKDLTDDAETTFWMYYDNVMNGETITASMLTNTIIGALFDAMQMTLEVLLIDGTEFDYYVNGEDSHFLVNGEYIQDVDLKELLKEEYRN